MFLQIHTVFFAWKGTYIHVHVHGNTILYADANLPAHLGTIKTSTNMVSLRRNCTSCVQHQLPAIDFLIEPLILIFSECCDVFYWFIVTHSHFNCDGGIAGAIV